MTTCRPPRPSEPMPPASPARSPPSASPCPAPSPTGCPAAGTRTAAATPTRPGCTAPTTSGRARKTGKPPPASCPTTKLADYGPWFDSHRRLRELVAELEELSLTIASRPPMEPLAKPPARACPGQHEEPERRPPDSVATPRLTCGPDRKKTASTQVSPKREHLTSFRMSGPFLDGRGPLAYQGLCPRRGLVLSSRWDGLGQSETLWDQAQRSASDLWVPGRKYCRASRPWWPKPERALTPG